MDVNFSRKWKHTEAFCVSFELIHCANSFTREKNSFYCGMLNSVFEVLKYFFKTSSLYRLNQRNLM